MVTGLSLRGWFKVFLSVFLLPHIDACFFSSCSNRCLEQSQWIQRQHWPCPTPSPTDHSLLGNNDCDGSHQHQAQKADGGRCLQPGWWRACRGQEAQTDPTGLRRRQGQRGWWEEAHDGRGEAAEDQGADWEHPHRQGRALQLPPGLEHCGSGMEEIWDVSILSVHESSQETKKKKWEKKPSLLALLWSSTLDTFWLPQKLTALVVFLSWGSTFTCFFSLYISQVVFFMQIYYSKIYIF